MKQKALIAVLLAIVLSDLAQPLMLEWRPKFAAAIAGAALYAGCALGVVQGWAPALWVVRLMPIVPLTTLGLWAAGVDVPAQPDAGMLWVLGLQLVAAGLAWALPPDQGSPYSI